MNLRRFTAIIAAVAVVIAAVIAGVSGLFQGRFGKGAEEGPVGPSQQQTVQQAPGSTNIQAGRDVVVLPGPTLQKFVEKSLGTKTTARKEATDRDTITWLVAEIQCLHEKRNDPRGADEELRAVLADLKKLITERLPKSTPPENLAEIQTKAEAGDLRPAEAFLARVIQNGSPMDAAAAAYQLGSLARALGELRQADGYYRRAMQFEPTNPTYRKALDEIATRFAAAREMISSSPSSPSAPAPLPAAEEPTKPQTARASGHIDPGSAYKEHVLRPPRITGVIDVPLRDRRYYLLMEAGNTPPRSAVLLTPELVLTPGRSKRSGEKAYQFSYTIQSPPRTYFNIYLYEFTAEELRHLKELLAQGEVIFDPREIPGAILDYVWMNTSLKGHPN